MRVCMAGAHADVYGERVRAAAPGCEIVRIGEDGSFSASPDGIDVMFFSFQLALEPAAAQSARRVLESPSLRWLQSPGAGVDHPIFQGVLARGVRLTNASGIHAEPIAQYIFAYVLHWERNVAKHLAQQAAREWSLIASGDLTEKTLGIVGLGGIGRAAARVAKGFGMRVVGTRRHPAPDPHVDVCLPEAGLLEVLAEAHYVALAVPLTDATHHLIGRRELEAMRGDAVLINVARGDVIDEEALIDVLRAGGILGATLDVASEEPLSAGSPLWGLPNCILTPHDSGYSPRADSRLFDLFVDNLGRYYRREPLRNEVRETGLAQPTFD